MSPVSSRVRPSSPSLSAVILCLPFAPTLFSHAFKPPSPRTFGAWPSAVRCGPAFRPSALFASPAPLDATLLDAARAKLTWEIIEEREGQPVLDFSRKSGGKDGPLALSEEAAAERAGESGETPFSVGNRGEEVVAAEPWEYGVMWKETYGTLIEMGALRKEDSEGAAQNKMLASAPQLLRLPTDQVVATAKAVLDAGIPTALLRLEPMLLTYPPSHIEGGLEFLGTMMMLPRKVVVTACGGTSGLLIGAVEGWMQEQAVKRALREAGEATSSANRRIAGDVAQGLRALGRKPPGAGLGE